MTRLKKKTEKIIDFIKKLNFIKNLMINNMNSF